MIAYTCTETHTLNSFYSKLGFWILTTKFNLTYLFLCFIKSYGFVIFLLSIDDK